MVSRWKLMFSQALRGALFLPAVLAAQASLACEETILLEYHVSDGRYQIELNDVYLESGAAQSASGGIPIIDWLLSGQNSIRVSVNAARGDFSVYGLCDDGSDKRVFDQVSLSGRQFGSLNFEMTDPPPRLFVTTEPTTDEGLLEAVGALKTAMASRDFDAVWTLHDAMRTEMDRAGRPIKAEAYQMGKIVDHIEPEFASDLIVRPVLGGRVWEVYGDQFAPPISATVRFNGGQVDFKTGSFWMKRDGVWSVYRK